MNHPRAVAITLTVALAFLQVACASSHSDGEAVDGGADPQPRVVLASSLGSTTDACPVHGQFLTIGSAGMPVTGLQSFNGAQVAVICNVSPIDGGSDFSVSAQISTLGPGAHLLRIDGTLSAGAAKPVLEVAFGSTGLAFEQSDCVVTAPSIAPGRLSATLSCLQTMDSAGATCVGSVNLTLDSCSAN